MKKTMTTLAIATILSSSFINIAQADEQPQAKTLVEHIDEMPNEEKWGISIGAVIGGIFGGPPGAFITAFAGDYFAKHLVSEREIDSLEQQLASEQMQRKNLAHKQSSELKNLELQYQNEMMNIAKAYENSEKAQVENILVSLMFRTGSSDIEAHYQQQVIALATVLKRSPHLYIDLEGYTDRQGDETLNLKLAQRRIDKVKQLLVAQGVGEDRIYATAFGESLPLQPEQQQEVNYFDRRVVLKLKVDSEEVAKQANL
ncbi:sortase-associated OmpA-like protein PdsO [Thalassotalea sp. HSM 43]|uniref:sortase-associated OmpA-like protein PdsO n=1 Tax=Thalassotalea sp. HSM 43 TaxID=2552945 RepID=UPI001080170E|nr:sortase-associated OmpA-like protein PdsO [Thalassotalea sp. HSM 43]QBY03641.1 sortase-associated OmpA-like protein PdsO [Thalassotalea sp. HSM 43]